MERGWNPNFRLFGVVGVLPTPLDFREDGVWSAPLDCWDGGVLSTPLAFWDGGVVKWAHRPGRGAWNSLGIFARHMQMKSIGPGRSLD